MATRYLRDGLYHDKELCCTDCGCHVYRVLHLARQRQNTIMRITALVCADCGGTIAGHAEMDRADHDHEDSSYGREKTT